MSDAENTLCSVKSVLQRWADKQGHDQCWCYPELFQELCALLDVVPLLPPELPSRSEFERGCRRYQQDIYEQ